MINNALEIIAKSSYIIPSVISSFLIPMVAIALLIVILIKKGQISLPFRNRLSANQKGEIGEKSVINVLTQNTSPDEQYLINNYLVKNQNFSAQIDHILINRFGVFVIETKNYAGMIYGNDTQNNWKQVIQTVITKTRRRRHGFPSQRQYYKNTVNYFYSPVKQNQVHISYIKKILKDVPVFSVVVFVQNNTRYIQSQYTVPLSALKSRVNNGTPVLDRDKIYQVYAKILVNRSTMQDEEHVAHIKENQAMLDHHICPRCGKPLVKRTGKYGEFWGCSNYPSCKFIDKRRQ